MATLVVGITGPYFDLPAALGAAQPGDTILVTSPRLGGADYSFGSILDEGLTISTTTDVGTVQLGLAAGVFDVTGAGPSNFVISGNANNNVLTAGDGNDVFIGAAGSDTFHGGSGRDLASYIDDPAGVSINLGTGSGSDGYGGTDTLNSIEALAGSHFGDTLIGGSGDDLFLGLAGNDTINGGSGTDTASYEFVGGATGVTVNLVSGSVSDGYGFLDTLISIEDVVGSKYSDHFIGNSGNNKFYGNAGDDIIKGGDGQDTAVYETALTGVNVNLATGRATDGHGSTDTLRSIEAITGGIFGDTLTGDSNANRLEGLLGADRLDGGDGVDLADYSRSAAGVNVNLASGSASDGFGSTDTLISIESVFGSNFADILTGDSSANLFSGLRGNDIILGGGGADVVLYAFASSQYTVTFNSGSNTYTVVDNTGVEGTDTLSSIEFLSFNDTGVVDITVVAPDPADQTIVGDDADNTFTPGAGDQAIDGRGGFDTVSYLGAPAGVTVNLATGIASDGQGGTDTLTSIERIIGTAFADNLTGSDADETFQVIHGSNVINGAAGTDTLSYAGGSSAVRINRFEGQVEEVGGNISTMDTFTGIENFVGTSHSDHFTDRLGANSYDGLSGDFDHLSFGSAGGVGPIVVDMVRGTATEASGAVNTFSNIDRISGTEGDDRFVWAPTTNYVTGNNGNDTLSFSKSTSAITLRLGATGDNGTDGNGFSFGVGVFDVIEGSAHNDVLSGYWAWDAVFLGLAGNDTLGSYSGFDSPAVDWASYRLDPQGVIASLTTGSAADGFGGTDTFINIDGLEGSNFNDELTGDDRDNLFYGLAGNDVIDGAGGIDTAIFALAADQYVVVHDLITDTYDITALSGDEGTDKLRNIETLSFDGGVTDVAIADAVTNTTSLDTTSDFDGDGDDDVVFSLTASGNSVHNSADGTGGGWIGYADRTVIGTGDFNGDGDADLLFRFTDGNHSGFDSGGGGPWLGRSDRTAVAVGDFNGDGDDDVLFQFANGNKHIADADSGNTWVGFVDRSIEGVGDFDGDGDDDVLFELNAGGYVTNNVDGTGGRWLGGWSRDVAGIGDFDGDGDDDILFVHGSGGHIINDGEGGGMQWFGFADRSVAGIGDFDGDGNDDILFRLADGNHTIISPNGVGRWIARTNNTVRDVGDYDGDGDDDILFEAPGGGFVVDQADGGVGLGMYFLDRTLVAGDPLGIGLTSDAELV